ncbi:MAG: MaoC family dehydratase [Rhodospirillales bacterium]|nr:MaoC family dehydratase [Rhodospirillales bacterium]
MQQKTFAGHFFEDFHLDQTLVHATPRTVTEVDVSLYTALYGSRFAANSSDVFAMDLGFEGAPVDDLLVFHIIFGKTVPDVSINAVANLGYASGTFAGVVYPGDTLMARSQVIGLKENSSGKTGVVYVRTQGRNQHGELLADYVRWVMVHKRDPASPAPTACVPALPAAVDGQDLVIPATLDLAAYDTALSGSTHLFDDYAVGEKIDHIDGTTIEEAEHMMATRLYQNTAKVHFNQLAQATSRFGQRLVYGGHIISLARALSYNGLANAFKIVAINAGSHTNPTFAGDTISAWTEVLDRHAFADRADIGALRLRTIASKNLDNAAFPAKDAAGKYLATTVLDFDYWVLMPRRG